MNKTVALLVVDAQYGFMPGGGLGISGADKIVPIINQIAPKFKNIIITQDWHPSNHISFAVNHSEKKEYEVIELPYGPQVLWPVHCVQGTRDAELHEDLELDHAQLIIRKGWNREVDSYSAFVEADRKTTTGLEGYLKERGIDHLYLCGLATDYCVAWSALDARETGFKATVIEDACRAIDLNGSLKEAWENMIAAGVEKITSTNIQ